MTNISNNDASDSDDSAPESISFDTGKLKTTEETLKVKEQINMIRESQKKKRIERQEMYIEQKKKKFENTKLSDEILDAVSSENSASKAQTKQIDASNRIKKKFENSAKKEANLSETTFSDFIPLKTYSNYGISVVNLEATTKKPLISSDRAKLFKEAMHNRPGLHRKPAAECIAYAIKRKFVK